MANQLMILLVALAAGGLVAVLLVVATQVARSTWEAVLVFRGIRTRVVCPRSGAPARVWVRREGPDGSGRMVVLRCQYYPRCVPRCSRACLGR